LYIIDTLKNIFNQTDKRWHILIIDDCSTSHKALNFLKSLEKKYFDKIKIIYKEKNEGAGKSRNIGVNYAFKNKYPFILFNDADDISHEKRLEVTRKIFIEDAEANVVYSTFKIIDEKNQYVSKDKVTPSVLEILEAHENNPPQGKNLWIDIGTKTGYINLTSVTSVKTDLAYNNPFPEESISEDAHTWMRYSAAGGKFVYSPEIPGLYRIPQNSSGSSSRSRAKTKNDFYKKMILNNTDGFKKSINLAMKNNTIDSSITDDLLIKFHIKFAETLLRENLTELAFTEIKNAENISKDKTEELIINNTKFNILKELIK